MKYLGKITDNKDLVTKEYVDGSIPDVSDKQDVIEVEGILEGDGEGNISAAETQEVTTLNVDSSPTANSSNLVTSGGVYTALQNASGGSNTYYGECSTAAATQAKTVTITGFPTTLEAGLSIRIKFTNSQTYAGVPTLNVNSTGAKNIQLRSGIDGIQYQWREGEVLDFVYDGTSWVEINGGTATTGYYGVTKLSSSTSSTSTSLAATPSAVKAAYDLANEKQSSITANGILKGNGSGTISAAVAGTDYQAPLTAGTDYQTPLVAGTDYAEPSDIPTKVSDLQNDSGFISSYTETDPTVPSWAKASTKPTYTASEVGAAESSHAHGNITNGGDITATAPTIASGDQIIINDHSASKITNGPTFDGSTTSKYLSQKGTWENVPTAASIGALTSESDPVFGASAAAGISSADISNWNAKQNALTIDSTPTNGSGNPVSSDGTYDMVMSRTKIYTASCSTAASTTAKVATLDDSTGFSLSAGVMVAVRFTYGNSAVTPTLNVNSTGAKTIAIPSSVTAYTTGSGTTYNTWGAYETILFTYTSTYWVHLPSGYLGYLAYNLASNALPSSTSIPTKVSDLQNDSGFITDYTETDPVFTASAAHGISSSDISAWNAKGTYSKPSGGIPKTDLASAVQTSLGKADTALQSYTETDPTVPAWAKASSKPSYTASEVGAAPTSHASTATTYGAGTSSNYGHVKLSDSTSSTSSTTGGIAATPAAVKAAYDLANGKQASIAASGILKGNGSGTVSAAVAGTDYQAPVSASAITTTTTWSGSGPYTQTVTLSGYTATANTKVDIQPTAAQITQLITDGVTSLLVSNGNGTLTMYATGAAPTTAMTIQATCTEVTAA